MKTVLPKISVLVTTSLFLVGCVSMMSQDTKVPASGSGGLSWRVSCDSKVERVENGFRFVTNDNTCTKNGKITGTYKQRNEINTNAISRTTRASYIFESKISITSDSSIPGKIFQVHDATLPGCSPPLSVEVGTHYISLASAYKYTVQEGDPICLPRKLHDKERGYESREPISFPRDGREHQFKVKVDFKGNEHFYVTVWLDDEEVIAGAYLPDVNAPDFMHSKGFYFKHGLYSASIFEYEMISKAVTLKRFDYSGSLSDVSSITDRSNLKRHIPLKMGSIKSEDYEDNIGNFDPSKFSDDYNKD